MHTLSGNAGNTLLDSYTGCAPRRRRANVATSGTGIV
jgi:hypothetical protein